MGQASFVLALNSAQQQLLVKHEYYSYIFAIYIFRCSSLVFLHTILVYYSYCKAMAGFLSQFVECCCCYSDVHTKCTTTEKMKAYSWFSNKHKSEFILFSILCTICLFIGFEAVTKFKLRKERQSSLILYSREYEPVSFWSTGMHFQILYEVYFWCLCTVTFW